MKKYDPKKVVITWKSYLTGETIYLHNGIVNGTFVTVARTVPGASLRVGGDSEATKIEPTDISGTVEVTQRNGSDTNAAISKVLEGAETVGKGNLGLLSVQDFDGDSLASSPDAFFEGFPAKSYSSDNEDDIVWRLLCGHLYLFHGSGADAT